MVNVRHFNCIATELPVCLSKNNTASPSSSAIDLKGERRPSLAFMTPLTSRFSPITPICVEHNGIRRLFSIVAPVLIAALVRQRIIGLLLIVTKKVFKSQFTDTLEGDRGHVALQSPSDILG